RADLPVIATIYSPLTTAYKLAGPALLTHIAQCPAQVHKALGVLADITVAYAQKSIQLGVDGFFFASQLANGTLMTETAYKEFGENYDLIVLESYVKKTLFNVVHIHGENAMFETLANYPVNCLSWHDRWIGPSLLKARKVTDKCLLGGIDEENVFGALTDTAFAQHVREALDMGGTKGFILGPGCTASPNMPNNHLEIITEQLRTHHL
ncbi:uroporphyrinogen decarboxylase, partial [Ruminococcaceae bacterium OttesenSCG-928-A11]|nr:uroporphyrinogen decarboxylase [Ruminococcaceae bacterium OttesenSCG-928-A11]